MTDLVFQSKKIARRRKTNVMAIAEMADGTSGNPKKTTDSMNPDTPRSEAII